MAPTSQRAWPFRNELLSTKPGANQTSPRRARRTDTECPCRPDIGAELHAWGKTRESAPPRGARQALDDPRTCPANAASTQCATSTNSSRWPTTRLIGVLNS